MADLAAPSRLSDLPSEPPTIADFTRRWLSELAAAGHPSPRSLLGSFPHVLDRICAAWGFPADFERVVSEGLLMDQRTGRQGFPFAALQEIHSLAEAHRGLFPPPACPWDSVPRR